MGPLFPGIREVRSPLTDQMLAPPDPRTHVVQFVEPLAPRDYERVADFIARHPDLTLRAYGHYRGQEHDISFLKYFPHVRHLQIDLLRLDSLGPLLHIDESLRSLYVGETLRPVSLAPLARFRSLEFLGISGKKKDVEVISELVSVRDLTLRSVTLQGLDLLRPLTLLESLNLKLGGTRDLRLLPEIGQLRYLELWLIRGLTDLGAVGELAGLQFLFLQALRRVEALPRLSGCRSLRRVHLETMKGITDLTPLQVAPALEQLLLIDMRHLSPDALTPLVGHPTLKEMTIGLGSHRKNEAARAIIDLPKPSGPFEFR